MPMHTPDLDLMCRQATDLLCRLIETPSVSRQEADAAGLIRQALTRSGLDIHTSDCNTWAVAPQFSPDRPTLLLNAHIDTVRPNPGWTRDPFKPTLEGDRLYGLGSNDCGGGLVSLLEVFKYYALTAPEACAYNLVYLASAEEEVSGRQGLESVLPLLPKIDVALVGEPTGMQPAVAEKGLVVIDATAHGKAGHAARNEGDNALYHAIDDINRLRHYRFERTSPLLGAVKLTVTIIQAGTQHNVVPAECTYTIDVRTNECYTNEEVVRLLQQEVRSELKPRSTRLQSSGIPLTHPLVARAVALGRTPYGSPTLSDQALMPFASLKMGPGESARSHTAEEYITTGEIRQGINLYLDLLRRT